MGKYNRHWLKTLLIFYAKDLFRRNKQELVTAGVGVMVIMVRWRSYW